MGVVFKDNTNEILKALQNATDQALEICGGKAESYAKDRCPVDTGNLANSITHRKTGDKEETIGTNVEYAPYVELGHRQEPGRYVPALGRRLVADHVDARPFLVPAVENHKDEYERVFRQALQNANV